MYSEFKGFFPNNAVEYYVSYYDYYQPEAYLPSSDTYIAVSYTHLLLMCACILPLHAQVGEQRHNFAVGVNGGINLNSVSFSPSIKQKLSLIHI